MFETLPAGTVKYEIVESNDPSVLANNESFIDEDSNLVASPVQSILHPRTSFGTSHSSPLYAPVPRSFDDHLPIRTVSRESSTCLRHPTPDLQSLQGAYVGNVERLEETAERLSLSSDIGEELRKIRLEQKRSESRSSSIKAAQVGYGTLQPSSSRQFSTASNASNLIQGINSIARSGGLSNGVITSPIGSVRSASWTYHSPRQRQISHADRLSRVEEPEREEPKRDGVVMDQSDAPISPRQLRVINHGLEGPLGNFENSREVAPLASLPNNIQLNARVTLERPDTAVSTETYQQGMHHFADFDGVHLPSSPQLTMTSNEHPSLNHRSSLLSISQSPMEGKRRSRLEPPAGTETMIYYPAPVPVMLNLPQKLSKASPTSRRDQQKSHLREAIFEPRKSTIGIPEVSEARDNSHDRTLETPHQDSGHLPPQLRAEIFFKHKSIQQDITIKGDSAVATLDSILDASAYAPVSAFIDHPIVGQVGKEIYGRATVRRSKMEPQQPAINKRRSISSLTILKNRLNSANILDEKGRGPSMASGTMLRDSDRSVSNTDNQAVSQESECTQRSNSVLEIEDPKDEDLYVDLAPEATELPDDHDSPSKEDEEYTGAPTTLLAELQLRKQQQKLRVRNAATDFPNGMHSTLLQLDAVAQVQKQSRKQKHITLAWEDPNQRNSAAENEGDEDVPLGVLYPGRKAPLNESTGWNDENQPLGLIAKRAMEDNEPLSRRRARLKGTSIDPRSTTTGPRDSARTPRPHHLSCS